MGYSLAGRHILFTGSAARYPVYRSLLLREKAFPTGIPLVSAYPVTISRKDVDALNTNQYSAVLFTSQNAVHFAHEVLPGSIFQQILNGRLPVFCTGEATAAQCKKRGLTNLVIGQGNGGLRDVVATDAFKALSGTTVLHPVGDLGAEPQQHTAETSLPTLHRVTVYKNEAPPDAAKKLTIFFRQQIPDWIILLSPSAVVRLQGIARQHGFSLNSVKFALIGERTRDCFESRFPGIYSITAHQSVPESIIDCMKNHADSA